MQKLSLSQSRPEQFRIINITLPGLLNEASFCHELTIIPIQLRYS